MKARRYVPLFFLLVLVSSLLLLITAQAAPAVSITLDKTSVEAGGTITATYSVTGRAGNIDAYLYVDGNEEDYRSLSASSGIFTFTLPKYGASGMIEITADDGTGGYTSAFSKKFTITNSPPPVNISFVTTASTAPGGIAAVSWRIEGGINPRVTAVDIATRMKYGPLVTEPHFISLPNPTGTGRTGSASVSVPGGMNSGFFDLLVEDPDTGYSEWCSSSDFTITGCIYTGWLRGWDDTIYEEGWAYFAGGVPQTGWKQDQGKWYYLQPGNYLTKSGWMKHDGNWYYFDWESGAMKTGWIVDGEYWYYANADGVMQTSWLQQGSSWYYLGTDGLMRTGWVNVGGTWYYMNASGAMQTGWVKSGSSWYYLKPDGSMATGWAKAGNSWYYMNASGVMQTGWINAGGAWYYMNGDGSMRTGWLEQGKSWYYLKSDGSMATGQYSVDGTVYLFNDSGVWIGTQINTY